MTSIVKITWRFKTSVGIPAFTHQEADYICYYPYILLLDYLSTFLIHLQKTTWLDACFQT